MVHFVMEHEQMTYPEALRWLAKKYNIEIKERELTDEEKEVQNVRESLFVVNEFARDYFQNILYNHADGKAIGMTYFRQRGIRDDIVKKFQLGYSTTAHDALAQEALRKGYKKEFLIKTGLCYEKEDGSLEVAGEKTTTEAVLADVKQELEDLRQFMDIGEGSVVVDETEDIDWINNWKQYFHQFYIDDILVIPSWENIKPEDTDKMVLHIDPGTAFGTGMHETTQLCIRQLRKFITPETELLDVGTGSGILAILSLMFGAKHAVGTDLDICAVEAVAQNCEVNGIDPAQFDMMIGNIITDKEVQDKVGYECYDIVVANILADVLVPLTPVIVHQLKKGGIYITSGIIDDKEQTVVEAVKAAGLEVLEVTYQGEWVSVTARKN